MRFKALLSQFCKRNTQTTSSIFKRMWTGATGSTMTVFVVKILEKNGGVVLPNTAINFNGGVLHDLFERCVIMKGLNLSMDAITEVRMRDSISAPHITAENPSMNVDEIFETLECKYLEFIVDRDRLSSPCSHVDLAAHACNPSHAYANPTSNTINAFSVLMHSNKSLSLPTKPTSNNEKKLTGPQRLHGDILDWMSSKGCGWSKDSLDTGEFVVKTLKNTLWYIDHAHTKFKDNGCPVPSVFSKFSGYNDFKKLHHRTPVITSEKLNELSLDLTKALSLPSMSLSRHKELSTDLESLLDCICKYKKRLDKDNLRHKQSYQRGSSPKRSLESNTSLEYITPSSKQSEKYKTLQNSLNLLNDYQYMDLDSYTPDDRLKRRQYMKNLALDLPVMIYRMAYGGSVGTLNFIWRVPSEDTPERASKNVQIVNKINTSLPKFSTRSMRRDFINRYSKHVNTPKSLLRSMFFELTGCESTSDSTEQALIDERVSILLDSDDPNLLLDFRALNGKDIDTKFGVFFEETGKYFDEQLLQVNERRHGQEMYLPMAISIEELRDRISTRVPEGTPIPCAETLRLQFQPNSIFQKSALKYSKRFNVKFRIQTRMARVNHVDARYVATAFKYLKQFCVNNRQMTTFICLDDKAIVPVGEPGIPISTGVRGHNRVLAPADGPQLVCTDHDFHVGGIIPSVTFVSTIPRHSSDSFFKGKIFVTTKDKVFQPSSPYRHTTEVTRILREHYSENNVDLENPILCLMTDGGPDHRVTFETVKLSLVQLFIGLNLDMLVALRTAPNHSWMNPAERCMSILNLALQHVALARKEMDGRFETAVKHKSSLGAIRNLAHVKQGFQNAYKESIDDTIELVNSRFKRMKLKDEPLEVYTGASDEDIEAGLEAVNQVVHCNANTEMSTADLRKMKELQTFLEVHGKSSHYMFQLKKCSTCSYCTVLQPPRVPNLDELSFLPDPVPGDDGQYLDFLEVYGQETHDDHRPSAAPTSPQSEVDRQNRELFKCQKVRDVVLCGECSKPRCIYSNKKMTTEQEDLLRRIKENGFFTCGDPLLPADCDSLGLVVRESISCSTEVESTYFTASLKHFLPPICIHCGSAENLLDDTDPYISSLYEEYSVVRPICALCRNAGRDAKTWGKKFLSKKART